MYKQVLSHHYSAAHKLNDYVGACANIHGHTWHIDISVETRELVNEMVIDFKDIKKAIDERYDHAFLNEKVSFNPTAENISKDIYDLVKGLYKGATIPTIFVTVWESEKAGITYTE